MIQASTIEAPLQDSNSSVRPDRGWIVTVFDNDTNTIDEVMTILMIATHCDADEAAMETWEVHHLGKSVVHVSNEEECRSVARVIAQIGIRVEVEPNE